MVKKPTGGSAFPQANHDAYGMGPNTIDDTQVFDVQGMTLRDYFAAQAMQGLISQSAGTAMASPPDVGARWAYSMADAMLAERSK